MNRILSFTLIAAVIFSFSACSSKKPPEQAAVKSKNVLSVLRDMSKTYEQKDLSAFLSNVSDKYQNRDSFSKTLTSVFSRYETIHFNIQYTKMLILIEEKGQTRATFTWDAEWTAAGGAAMKDGGRVTLVFEPGAFKLSSIDGKNPFLAQPGETPGASKP